MAQTSSFFLIEPYLCIEYNQHIELCQSIYCFFRLFLYHSQINKEKQPIKTDRDKPQNTLLFIRLLIHIIVLIIIIILS